jgi:NitT/TauT family transport system ATP-binding protein
VSSTPETSVRGQTTAAGTTTPLIEVRGVKKSFVTRETTVNALAEVNLDIHAGEFVSFVGPSGCGKSTLLNIIAGLLSATEGTVTVDGERLTSPRRDMAFMFQAAVLLPWRSVESNVLMPAEVMGLDKDSIRPKALEILRTVGLGDFLDALPSQLSGGMQQRVSLARVLTYQPKVLLMDEPFGALDEFTREAMNLELMRLAKETGITILFVTHNISEAIFLSHRVVVMSARPSRVAGVVESPFEWPRGVEVMAQPKFTDLSFQIRTLLGGHV